MAEKVCLITPARFLFNVGKTPKDWNKKMLSDEHFKVLLYEQDSRKMFTNMDIKGGVAVTCHDIQKNYGAIQAFTHFDELNSILKKVSNNLNFETIDKLVYVQNKFNLDTSYKKYTDYKKIVGNNGKEKRITTPIFS